MPCKFYVKLGDMNLVSDYSCLLRNPYRMRTENPVDYENKGMILLTPFGFCNIDQNVVICDDGVIGCLKGKTLRQQLEYLLKKPEIQKELSKIPWNISLNVNLMLYNAEIFEKKYGDLIKQLMCEREPDFSKVTNPEEIGEVNEIIEELLRNMFLDGTNEPRPSEITDDIPDSVKKVLRQLKEKDKGNVFYL